MIALISCGQAKKPEIIESEEYSQLDHQTAKEFSFNIEDLQQEDFEIIEKTDTIYYIKKLYEEIGGKHIQFNPKVFKNVTAKIQFNLGFVQYTIDDNPAYPLDFTKRSKWSSLKVKEGIIEIPDFHENAGQIIKQIESEDFKLIKAESIQEQTDFFQNLIQHKKQYENCCPEYIEQANGFINTPVSDLDSIDKLGLELIYKQMIIEINGLLSDGRKFRQVIIEKE